MICNDSAVKLRGDSTQFKPGIVQQISKKLHQQSSKECGIVASLEYSKNSSYLSIITERVNNMIRLTHPPFSRSLNNHSRVVNHHVF